MDRRTADDEGGDATRLKGIGVGRALLVAAAALVAGTCGRGAPGRPAGRTAGSMSADAGVRDAVAEGAGPAGPSAPPGPARDASAPSDGPPAPGPALGCSGLPRPNDPYRTVDVFPRLPRFAAPTAAVQAPGQAQLWYVLEQGGVVKRFANRPDVASASIVLDLSDRVDSEIDAGLVGIAFHPDFADNGQVFLSYSRGGPTVLSRVSRFVSDDGGATLDPDSEEVILEIPQPDPEKTHLGCDIHFGPDGHLWVGFGDGGFEDDGARDEAQDLGSLRGKILRIDVDHEGPGGEPYAIPADNPFAGRAGARGEIWALGLRNPWRWRFDPAAPGVLWAGDVGAERREEIDRVVAGGNYGWKRIEGSFCARPPCETAGLQAPWVEYPHPEGKAVAVGPVYRGQAVPALRDRLIYGDFIAGHVWALPPDRSPRPELILSTRLSVVSFGESLDGELFLVDLEGGRLHQVLAAPPSPGGLPARLSQTGCLDPGPGGSPRLLPYDVNAPLWSDGAAKRRWMSLPPGARIAIAADGDFVFPVGTTLVKEFSLGTTRVETRLFVRHADGAWAGYSYGWNDEQTDATLLGLSSKVVRTTVAGAGWNHPSRWQCMLCHAEAAGFALGLEVAQLNRTFRYPEGERNQLAHLEQLGLLAAPLPAAPAALPALPDPAGNAPLAARARAYLHGNCAGCHRPDNAFYIDMDLRFATPLADSHTCGEDAGHYAGFEGADERVSPGRPATSLMARLMRSTDELRMPLVGTTRVDQQGAALIESWISSLTDCP